MTTRPTMYLGKNSIVLSVIMCLNMHLSAQQSPHTVRTVWGGTQTIAVLEPSQAFLESYTSDGFKKVVIPPLPISGGPSILTDYYNGHIYAVKYGSVDENPHPSGMDPYWVYRCSPGQAWELVATLRQPYFRGVQIFPLESGKFIGFINNLAPFIGAKKPSMGYKPVVILAKNEKNELFIDDWVDLGFKKPYYKEPKGDSTNRNVYNYSKLSIDVSENPQIIRIGEYFAIISHETGYIFVYSAKDGSFKRVVKVYPKVDEESLEDIELGCALIGVQPRSDGRLLIAARVESAVVQNKRAIFSPRANPEVHLKQTEIAIKVWNENLKLYPAVVWYVLDPGTGEIYPEAAPYAFPSLVSTMNELWNFRFRFKADGNLTLHKYSPAK